MEESTSTGMKRMSDFERGSPQKRPRPGDTEVRLLIHSKSAGSIIGKGGSNITRLRTENNASVTVPDCPGPERILTVSADRDVVLKVLEDLIPNLEDFPGKPARSDMCELRLLVHQSLAGCVIGRGGAKIKELREDGAEVKVYSECCPQSTERIVQIGGKVDVALECLEKILGLLDETPIKGFNHQYDPDNFNEFFAPQYGGYGEPGRGGPRGGPPGPPMRGPPPGRGFDDGMGPGGGMGGPPGPRGPMNGRGPMNRGPPALGGLGRPGGFGRDGPGNGPHFGDFAPRPRPLGDGDGGGDAGGPQNTQQVTIPKDLAGAIIGKGGARIRKIRADSGANITIEEALPGSSDRVISIRGNPTEIQMAQYLLQQSVRDNTARKY